MDADLELQGLIINTLKADPIVVSLVGQRIYDTIPPNAVFPYISYGPSDTIENDADCITGLDVAVQLDAWSRSVGYPEVKKIADAVRAALNDRNLTMTINALVFLEHRQTRIFRDSDGLTNHAAIAMEAAIENRPAPVFP